MRMIFPAIAAALSIAAPLSGCGQPKEIYIDNGFVRLPAVPGRPGVAYFTLHGGMADATLISVTSPSVIKTELHESMMSGSMASMQPIANVPLAAKAKISFAPGGKHVMLFDINKMVKAGDVMPLVFTFSNNLQIEYDAPVIGPGDPAPK